MESLLECRPKRFLKGAEHLFANQFQALAAH